MTYNEWERDLLDNLKALPPKDKDEVASYYKEMRGDKLDAGMTDEEIIKEFGEPKLVAARIISENAAEEKEENANIAPREIKASEEKAMNISVSKIIGWFFLITLVLIPIAAVVISVIAAFCAVTVSGAAMIIGGIVAAIGSPFSLIVGYTGMGVLALAGASLGTAGVGALLFVPFYFITKYAIVSTCKSVKYIAWGRRRK